MNWQAPKDVQDDVNRILKSGGIFPEPKMDAPLTAVVGSAGSGKTRWAALVTMAGPGWTYVNARELMNDMRAECKKSKDAVSSREKFLQNVPRLVIDDIGDESQTVFADYKTEYHPIEIIRTIWMARCRPNVRTVFTTNLEIELLLEMYDHDKKTQHHAGRIFSRMCNHARIYLWQGDRRKQQEDGKPRKITEREVLWLKGGKDEEGNQLPDTKIGNPIKTTMECYEPSTEGHEPEVATPDDIAKAIDDVNGKGELEVSYYNWLMGGEFKHLIPKEWHERKAARDKEVKLAARAREKREKKQVAAKATGGDAGGDGLPAGILSGAGEGAVTGEGASGGDGEGGEVDISSVPDWDN